MAGAIEVVELLLLKHVYNSISQADALMKTCSRTVHGKITPASGKFFFPRRHKNRSSGGSSRRSCRQYALDLGVSAQSLSRRLPAILRGTRARKSGIRHGPNSNGDIDVRNCKVGRRQPQFAPQMSSKGLCKGPLLSTFAREEAPSSGQLRSPHPVTPYWRSLCQAPPGAANKMHLN